MMMAKHPRFMAPLFSRAARGDGMDAAGATPPSLAPNSKGSAGMVVGRAALGGGGWGVSITGASSQGRHRH